MKDGSAHQMQSALQKIISYLLSLGRVTPQTSTKSSFDLVPGLSALGSPLVPRHSSGSLAFYSCRGK